MTKAMYSLIEMKTGVTRYRLDHYKDMVVRGSMIPYEYVLEFDEYLELPFAYHWRDKLAMLQEAVRMEKRMKS